MNQITKTIITVVITLIAYTLALYWLGTNQEVNDFESAVPYKEYMEGCIDGAIGLTDYATAHDYCHCTYKELSSYENEEILDIMKDAFEDELSPETAKIMVDVAIKCRGEIK